MSALIPGHESVSEKIFNNQGMGAARPASGSGERNPEFELSVSVSEPLRILLCGLLIIVAFLGAMHFFPEQWSFTIHDRFNLDGEANIPSWFSSMLLFSVALTALANYFLEYGMRQGATFWLVFSAVYAFLSVDESARLHEIFDSSFSIKWIFIYAPFAAVFFFYSVYRIYRQESATVWNWVIGGLVVYAAGGLVGEFVDYLFYHTELEVLFEEVLEMSGTSVVLVGCLHKLTRRLARPV